MKTLIPALALGVAVLAGCGSPTPTPVAYDPSAYAAAVCVDRASWYRVPDNYCPIGDDEFPNHPFMWVYDEYSDRDLDVDVVYVGYPVERTRYVATRPLRVSTINIDRGRFPEKAAPGAASSTSVKLPSAPVERRAPVSTVQRGGLGAPNARATNVPRPNRDTSSPAPGRSSAAPAPRATPPRVSGSRPMSSGSTSVRTGRK